MHGGGEDCILVDVSARHQDQQHLRDFFCFCVYFVMCSTLELSFSLLVQLAVTALGWARAPPRPSGLYLSS